MMLYILGTLVVLITPIVLLLLGMWSTRKWRQNDDVTGAVRSQGLDVARWTGWCCCALPILRVLLIPFEIKFGGPGSRLNEAILLATLVTGMIAMALFILNATGRERCFGTLAAIGAILSSICLFLSGLFFAAMSR